MSHGSDTRPARGGWAPGGYACHCSTCHEPFSGAKHSYTCAPCEYARTEEDLARAALSHVAMAGQIAKVDRFNALEASVTDLRASLGDVLILARVWATTWGDHLSPESLSQLTVYEERALSAITRANALIGKPDDLHDADREAPHHP